MSNKNLSDKEHALLTHLRSVGAGVDVLIVTLHDILYGEVDRDHKVKQQYVGSIVSRINRKQADYKIIPGERKRTYRLVALTVRG